MRYWERKKKAEVREEEGSGRITPSNKREWLRLPPARKLQQNVSSFNPCEAGTFTAATANQNSGPMNF